MLLKKKSFFLSFTMERFMCSLRKACGTCCMPPFLFVTVIADNNTPFNNQPEQITNVVVGRNLLHLISSPARIFELFLYCSAI